MLNAAHKKAQALSAEAAIELRAGHAKRACDLFAKAAELEREALGQIPRAKTRTWGAVAVSVAALLYKAKRLPEAELTLYELLANREMSTDARDQLRDLLTTVRDELSLPPGFEYAGRGFELTLRGGEVGEGSAPFDLVLQKSEQVRNFIERGLELRAGFPFRASGAPPPEIIEMIQARATQARVGSFRFTIRLAAPSQVPLFPELAAPKLEGLTDFVFRFVSTAASSRPDRAEVLKQLVPQPDYRVAMLKLLRSVAPHGKQVSEVEFTPVGRDKSGVPERFPVVLTRDVRPVLEEAIRAEAPEPAPEQQDIVRGTLRAVHLDQKWILVVQPDGRETTCHIVKLMLDDLVGPLVNHKVVVRGTWRGTGIHRKFELSDVDQSDE